MLTDLQVIQQTMPENTPARIEATREVLKKHGMTMPPMLDAQGANQYEQIPTSYERAQTKSAEARTGRAGISDPVKKATAVAKLIGSRPWSGDEGDAYDPKNPEHRIWMQSLQELAGEQIPDTERPTDLNPESAPAETGKSFMQTVRDTVPVRAAPAAGLALSQIETPDHWRARVRGDRSQEQANAAAHTTPIPLGGLSGNLGNIAAQTQPAAGPRPGSALAGIPSPSAEQIDAALGQYEQAGGVTVRNAQKVRQSQAAPASTLAAAARAVKVYKASPEYVEMTRTTGRLLNETDLSGQIKSLLAQQSASDQKRLLTLIHRHGEAAVLEAVAKAPQGHGQ